MKLRSLFSPRFEWFTLILTVAYGISTLLNLLQSLNGVFCFSQELKETYTNSLNVGVLTSPYGAPLIDIQGFCFKNLSIGGFDSEIASTECYQTLGDNFNCTSKTKTKFYRRQDYSCECSKDGSGLYPSVNLIVSIDTVVQSLLEIQSIPHTCRVKVTTGSCYLNKNFYKIFLITSGSLIGFLLIISNITSLSTKHICKKLPIQFCSFYPFLEKNGFLKFCNWFGSSVIVNPKKNFCFLHFDELDDKNINPLDYIQFKTSLSMCSDKGFYKVTSPESLVDYPENGSVVLKIQIGKFNSIIKIKFKNLQTFTTALSLILDGGFITSGDHILSLEEIKNECESFKEIFEYKNDKECFGLNEDLISHNSHFFGENFSEGLKRVLSKNIKNPLPKFIKSNQWKRYVSDLFFHFNLNPKSKMKKFRPSNSFYEFKKSEPLTAGLKLLGELDLEYLKSKNYHFVKKAEKEKFILKLDSKNNFSELDKKVFYNQGPNDENDFNFSYYRPDKNNFEGRIYSESDDFHKSLNVKWLTFKGMKIPLEEKFYAEDDEFIEAVKKTDFIDSGEPIIINPTFKHKEMSYLRVCKRGLKTEVFDSIIKISDGPVKERLNFSSNFPVFISKIKKLKEDLKSTKVFRTSYLEVLKSSKTEIEKINDEISALELSKADPVSKNNFKKIVKNIKNLKNKSESFSKQINNQKNEKVRKCIKSLNDDYESLKKDAGFFKNNFNSTVKIRKNPYYLTHSLVEKINFLNDYTKRGELQCLCFSSSKLVENVKLEEKKFKKWSEKALFKSNLHKKMSEMIKKEEDNDKNKSKSKNKNKNKNKNKSEKAEKSEDYNNKKISNKNDVTEFENKNPKDLKNLKMLQKFLRTQLKNPYFYSKKCNNQLTDFIFKDLSKNGLRSCNNINYLGKPIKKWGFKNSMMKFIVKKFNLESGNRCTLIGEDLGCSFEMVRCPHEIKARESLLKIVKVVKLGFYEKGSLISNNEWLIKTMDVKEKDEFEHFMNSTSLDNLDF